MPAEAVVPAEAVAGAVAAGEAVAVAVVIDASLSHELRQHDVDQHRENSMGRSAGLWLIREGVLTCEDARR